MTLMTLMILARGEAKDVSFVLDTAFPAPNLSLTHLLGDLVTIVTIITIVTTTIIIILITMHIYWVTW